MHRRNFLGALGAAASMPFSRASRARSGVPVIGVLWHAGSIEEERPYFSGLDEGFRQLGYVGGSTAVFVHRFPDEKPDRFKSMAAELAGMGIDVLVCVGPQTAPYAKAAAAARNIPVVFIFVPDPVGSNLVESLRRPGMNITGLSNFGADLVSKRLEILQAIVPKMRHVAVLVNPNSRDSTLYKRLTEEAASMIGLASHPFEARSAAELEPAFDAMQAAGMQAVTINAEGVAYQRRASIPVMALNRRLPLCVWSKETFEHGALMSYGPDQVAMCRRAASLVDKILKGTPPSEIPVEQPASLELRINLRTARALGMTVPDRILVQAHEVVPV